MSNSNEKMESLSATQPYKLTEDLTLSPRIKLLLVIHRSDTSVSPLDEWKFKNSIITFLKTSFTSPISVPQEDLILRRFKDLKKRKREDPVAVGSLFVRDLGFVVRKSGYDDGDDEGDNEEKKFLEWRKLLVEKMDGMEVSLEGVKFRVSVRLPISDDLKLMTKEWQEFYAFGAGSRSRDGNKEPDTIVIRGLPSRWFAEPRVSSKPSMLVTHTIFSVFGKIRNLNVAEDDDLGKDTDADDGDLISGLQCKVVVQFEQYKDFFNALKVLCSRSLQKEGSRMKADYEVTWDKDGFFQNARRHPLERLGQYNYEGPKHQSYNSRSSSRYSPEDLRSKRFKG